MRLARWSAVAGSWFLAALLSVPAWGANADYNNRRQTAMPGTLNYVEGEASVGDQSLDSKSVGSATLQDGQVLETGNGKAEVLLTPGVYLRLGSNNSTNCRCNCERCTPCRQRLPAGGAQVAVTPATGVAARTCGPGWRPGAS